MNLEASTEPKILRIGYQLSMAFLSVAVTIANLLIERRVVLQKLFEGRKAKASGKRVFLCDHSEDSVDENNPLFEGFLGNS